MPRAAQTFIKVVNYQHMMPTRYTLDVDLKAVVTQDVLDNSTKKQEARKVRLSGPCSCTCCCVERAGGKLGRESKRCDRDNLLHCVSQL